MRLSTFLSFTVLVVSQAFAKGYNTCSHPRERNCVLVHNGADTCTTPSVRREWRDLEDSEKKAFLDAVKCLSYMPHGDLVLTNATPGIPAYDIRSSKYDDFVYTHMDTNVKDHFTALFLPWHRWYLLHFEKTLRDQCSFEGALPFWDWSRDTEAGIQNSSIFNSSTTHGIGTLGTSATNYSVTDGVFWDVKRAYPKPHITKRNYTTHPFKTQTFPFTFTDVEMSASMAFMPEKIDELVMGSAGNYTDFQYKMDGERAQGMHNAAHLMMQGDLGNPLWSPNDVLFWMHHAHLDCIWARWQANKTENAMAFGGGLTQNLTFYDLHPVGSAPDASLDSELPTSGLAGSGPVYVRDMMSAKGAGLCYRCAF
ncbi:tyrosinase [Ceratobasidium sp. AG-Ba]|nr:tyrosinase [Ceratobasidium sp. AG-Ba]